MGWRRWNTPYDASSLKDELKYCDGRSEPWNAVGLYECVSHFYETPAGGWRPKWRSLWSDIGEQLEGNTRAGLRVRKSALDLKKKAAEARKNSLLNRENPILKLGEDHKGWLRKGWGFWLAQSFEKLERGVGHRGKETKLSILGDELNKALQEAAKEAFGVYRFERKINKAAAQRFRNITFKIEELAAAIRKESLRVMKCEQDPDFFKAEYPIGSLVSYDWVESRLDRNLGRFVSRKVSSTGVVCGHTYKAKTTQRYNKSSLPHLEIIWTDSGRDSLSFFEVVMLSKTTLMKADTDAEATQKKPA